MTSYILKFRPLSEQGAEITFQKETAIFLRAGNQQSTTQTVDREISIVQSILLCFSRSLGRPYAT